MKNILAGLLPLAAMGLTNTREDFEFVGGGKVGTRKTQLSNKEWLARKKRISNEKHARAINRK